MRTPHAAAPLRWLPVGALTLLLHAVAWIALPQLEPAAATPETQMVWMDAAEEAAPTGPADGVAQGQDPAAERTPTRAVARPVRSLDGHTVLGDALLLADVD